ncbi:MAG: DUF2284 domain-containing protein [Tissierellia bacterium]|jgi:predicted metal-binding protein|nr:DUF2284 domain-containing protein [Tissierellia bacterium]
MENNELLKVAAEVGFEYYGMLNVKTLELLPEVRDMCKANRCGMYGKNWACPPGCGTLEECRARINKFESGLIVQTMGKIKNSFDYRGMMEMLELHKKRFLQLRDLLVSKDKYKEILPLNAGACTVCKECTYPDEACRFEDKAFASLESYGIYVSRLCRDNGLAYYYGPDTMSYTGCFLLRL